MWGHKIATVAKVIAAVATVLVATVTLYTHYAGDEDDVAETISAAPNKAGDNDGAVNESPSIKLAEVFVTPIETKLPSTFYVEIVNVGNGEAKNFNVTIDFGESSPENCEWVPNSIVASNESESSAIRIISVAQLRENQSFYVVCHLNAPFFKKVTVHGGNVAFEKSMSYEQYKSQRPYDRISFYQGLWRVVVVCLMVFFLTWFFVIMSRFLDFKFRPPF